MSLKWYGREYRRALEAEMRRRLTRAAIVVEGRAKQLLSVSGTGRLVMGSVAKNAAGVRAVSGSHRRWAQAISFNSRDNRIGQFIVGRGGTVIERAVKTGRNRVYGAFPSKPGEPPHKQTGHLRMSVTYEVTKGWDVTSSGSIVDAPMSARVGTNVKYGRYLELGTKHVAPRPWLRRALDESAARAKLILTAPARI